MTSAPGPARNAAPAESERLLTPAAQRNREPILRVLRRLLAPGASVLEIGSGTGAHVAYFAPHLPEVRWQPSDPDPAMRRSITAWCMELANVASPLPLDVLTPDWSEHAGPGPDLILSVNMLHVAPAHAVMGLLDGAAALLASGGLLVLYGPFRFNGQYCGQGNERFDRMLQQQNSAWGLRDLNDIAACAGDRFVLERVVDMPAANHMLVLRRS